MFSLPPARFPLLVAVFPICCRVGFVRSRVCLHRHVDFRCRVFVAAVFSVTACVVLCIRTGARVHSSTERLLFVVSWLVDLDFSHQRASEGVETCCTQLRFPPTQTKCRHTAVVVAVSYTHLTLPTIYSV